MAVTRTQMYCPVSNTELADGRPLSSRVARDWSRQLNNIKAYACAPMIVLNNTYPNGGLVTAADDTLERYVARWAPVPLPPYFTRVRVAVCYRVAQALDSVTLRMYVDHQFYSSDATVAPPTGFSADRQVGSSGALTSTSNAVVLFTVSGFTWRLTAPGGAGDTSARMVYLTLTKQSADATDIIRVLNVAAWAMAPA